MHVSTTFSTMHSNAFIPNSILSSMSPHIYYVKFILQLAILHPTFNSIQFSFKLDCWCLSIIEDTTISPILLKSYVLHLPFFGHYVRSTLNTLTMLPVILSNPTELCKINLYCQMRITNKSKGNTLIAF